MKAGPLPARTCSSAAPGRLAHRPEIVAVDHLRGQLHRLDAADRGARGHVGGARVLAVDIVLADVQRGEREDLREVEALVEVGLVDRAVAEERDGDVPVSRSASAAPVAAAMLPPTIP